ncbi:MAG: chorismate-binding protein [Verrucomicrobiota bacterium]
MKAACPGQVPTDPLHDLPLAPSGSKIRAVQIISRVEKSTRGPYGGCVGYFSFNGNLDCCITIRTALVKDGRAYVKPVADGSTAPEGEFQETVNKSKPCSRRSPWLKYNKWPRRALPPALFLVGLAPCSFGYCSQSCLVLARRVRVDGVVCRDPEAPVDPGRSGWKSTASRCNPPGESALMLNKPRGL